jgi:predicted transcriptional regulator of viral defense system
MVSIRRIRSVEGRDRLAAVLRQSSGVVTAEDAVRALNMDRRHASKLLARWAGQGWLKRLRRGLYAPIPIDALSSDRTLRNSWVLVPELFSPGYVGGWSAAAHWGLTEQIFRDVCVFTAKPFRGKRETIEGVTFFLNRLQSDALFGTMVVWEGKTRIPVSDPHKTLIDMLARPATGGGIRHVEACLAAYLETPERDLEKLVGYGDRLGNGAVFKRLGFLLSRRPDAPPAAVAACRSRLKSGNVKLDPALACAQLVTRWKLWVPKPWKPVEDLD